MITLRTLDRATAQEVFDQVAKHLLKQGERSTGKHGFCVYKSEDGKMCAAGCLIGKKEYRKKYEGAPWDVTVRNHGITQSNMRLIIELQKVHDNLNPKNWRHSLKELAKEYSLNTDCLK
jgi:hypothetical protein